MTLRRYTRIDYYGYGPIFRYVIIRFFFFFIASYGNINDRTSIYYTGSRVPILLVYGVGTATF